MGLAAQSMVFYVTSKPQYETKLRQLLTSLEQLQQDSPDDASIQSALADCYHSLGNVVTPDEPELAREYLAKSAEILEVLTQQDSDNAYLKGRISALKLDEVPLLQDREAKKRALLSLQHRNVDDIKGLIRFDLRPLPAHGSSSYRGSGDKVTSRSPTSASSRDPLQQLSVAEAFQQAGNTAEARSHYQAAFSWYELDRERLVQDSPEQALLVAEGYRNAARMWSQDLGKEVKGLELLQKGMAIHLLVADLAGTEGLAQLSADFAQLAQLCRDVPRSYEGDPKELIRSNIWPNEPVAAYYAILSLRRELSPANTGQKSGDEQE